MDNAAASPRPAWYTTRKFFGAVALVLTIKLGIIAYLAIFVRQNDFLVHRGFGQAFLQRDPHMGLQVHYLLGRGAFNALTAWLPYRVDRTLHFVLSVVAVGWVFVAWNRWVQRDRPAPPRLAAAAASATLALMAAYLVRDLDDCGLQIWLLFFLTAGGWCVSTGRPLWAGWWLGLAATYKVTPLLFFPYLLWKRQWRAASAMAVCTVLFNVLPVLYLGADLTWQCHQRWFSFTARSLTVPDPSENGLEPPRNRNQGLPMMVARYTQTYAPGHPLHLAHAAFLQPGNLEAASARHVRLGIFVLLAAALAWRCRRPFASSAGSGGLANEWAALVLLSALLSPLCWLQHLVVVLPAAFLWLRAWLADERLPRWHRPVMAVAVLLILLVHRELCTKPVYEVLISYKPHTVAALLMLLLVLTLPERRQQAAAAVEPVERAEERQAA